MLLTQLIALGKRDSGIYYAVAISLGLSGHKESGKKYLDTAVRLGWKKPANGDVADYVLDIPKTSGDDSVNAIVSKIRKDAVVASLTLPKGYENIELYRLYYEDQKEREYIMQHSDDIDTMLLVVVSADDADRRRRASGLLARNQISTALDLEEAAMLLQHGDDTSDYMLAHELALRSIKLGNISAKWLAAATMDRYLVATGKPQRFGTQSFYNDKTGKEELYPVDPLVTDEERAMWNVPPLKNSLDAFPH
jgi:hypothetical protein